VYFEETEYTYDLSTLPTTSTGITGSSFAGPTFQTFILPGETNMQISYTFECDRTDSSIGDRTLRIASFIANAISGSNTGLTSYGKFDSQSTLQSQNITTVPDSSPKQRSGANTQELRPSGTGTQIADRQGMYVLIHTMINVTNNTGLTGTLKLKNFVCRISRTVGSSIAPSPSPPPSS